MPSASLSSLRSTLIGPVITADEPEYDAIRQVFAGDIDRRPAAIARPADPADVMRVIAFARDNGTSLAVRSGGHSPFASLDGGIVLDLRDMRSLVIDDKARTAWAGTGLTAAEYSRAVGRYGLATDLATLVQWVLVASFSPAGLVSREKTRAHHRQRARRRNRHGRRRAAPRRPPEARSLFWAIRGGGGNFGVVTRFHYRLHPVSTVVGGMLMLPATVETIAGSVAAAAAAPEELTVIANVMTAPPLPFVPAEHHGGLVVLLLMCHAGEPESSTNAIAPFRALATPIVDMVRPIRYQEIFPPDDPSYHPTAVGRTMFLDEVDRPVAETILEYQRRSDAVMRVAQLRVLGGAMARVAPEATAFAHRRRRGLATVAAFYEGASDRPRREAWVLEFADALRQGDEAGYIGFVGNEGEARVRAAYPGETWERLAAIKARYDAGNLFRVNGNIAPALVKQEATT